MTNTVPQAILDLLGWRTNGKPNIADGAGNPGVEGWVRKRGAKTPFPRSAEGVGYLGVYPLSTSEHAMDDNLNPDGRTPEEDRRYRVKNRLRLREIPMTKEEQQDAIDMIFEMDAELLQILADA